MNLHPKKLFPDPLPFTSVVPLSKPAMQLTGTAFTGFNDTQGSAVRTEPVLHQHPHL